MPKKWIDKKSAVTFELVHRSHEDEHFHNEEAGGVLVRQENLNDKEHKQARIDKWITGPRLAQFDGSSRRENEGEAATYGITFDDSKYDYMQHLRAIGEHDDAIFVSSSGATKNANKVNAKAKAKSSGLQFKEDDIERRLPAEVLPQESREYNYQDQQGIQDSIAGLQPDMDPRLKEILEALEDEEYVEDGDDVDDLFGALQKEAEPLDMEEFAATLPEESTEIVRKQDEQDWEFEFRKFKQSQGLEPKAGDDLSDDGFSSDFAGSEAGDTVGDLPEQKSKPRKKKIGAKTDLTGFSMSSSANFRNKGLELLDDRFDTVEALYANDEEESEGEEFDMSKERKDLDSIMDDFLQNEVLFGKKLYKRNARR